MNITIFGRGAAPEAYRTAARRIADDVRWPASVDSLHGEWSCPDLFVLAGEYHDAAARIGWALRQGANVLVDVMPMLTVDQLLDLYATAHVSERTLRIGVPWRRAASQIAALGPVRSIDVERIVTGNAHVPLIDGIGVDYLAQMLAFSGVAEVSTVTASVGRGEASLLVERIGGVKLRLTTRRGGAAREQMRVIGQAHDLAEIRFEPPVFPGGDESVQVQRRGPIHRVNGKARRNQLGAPVPLPGRNACRALALRNAVDAIGREPRWLPWPNEVRLVRALGIARQALEL